MDFDDLLVRTVNLLELFADVRERYRRTFRWVLVDEYQDTNRAQYRLLQLLHRGAPQPVRGRRRRPVDLRLPRTPTSATSSTSSATSPTPTVVKLEQNYRSTQTILDAANAVDRQQHASQKPKHLWTDAGARRAGRRSPSSTTSTPRRATSPRRSSGWSRRAMPRDEIAVFYRINAQSRVLEDTLVRFEIPYQVIGGTKFYERAEIKDAIAYLSLLANPADAVSFARIVNSPRRGIGQTTQARLLSHANTTRRRHLGGVRAARPRSRRSAPRRSRRSTASPRRWPRLRERAERGGAGRRAARGDAARDRLHRGARGRAHDRGRGPGREPRGAGRRRRRVRRQPRARGRVGDLRRWRSSWPRSRCSPSRTRSATPRAWRR